LPLLARPVVARGRLSTRPADPAEREHVVAKTRQILLVKILRTDEDDADTPSILNSIPLGTQQQVIDALSVFNTAPDGSKDPESFGVMHGPGFIAQLPMTGPKDPVSQIAVSIQEEEIAWPVLSRVCKRLNWMMMDPTSGRTFGGW
jgi:hypothetical protein